MRIPLLMDHHNHFYIYSMLAGSVNLQSITEKRHAIELIETKRDKEVSVVLGWNDRFFRFSDKELDSFPPVVICNLSLHGFLINAAARERLGERDRHIIENIDDDRWRERNLTRILGFLASLNPLRRNRIYDFADTLGREGVWALQDMLVSDRGFLEVLKDSGLYMRIFPWTDLSTFETLPPALRDSIRGIKIFADGALGSQTAALRVPYRNGSTGTLNHSTTGLKAEIKKILDIHHSIAIHAIGDRAIDQVLNCLPDGISENDKKIIRLEHCQFISRRDAFRARDKRIILCMQPNFSSDSSVYSDRLPDGYAQLNNPFRMLIDEVGFVPGENLLFGSDGMPHGIREALRQSLFPAYGGQRLTLDEFVAGYCWDNTDPGHIEIEINTRKQEVRTRVVLA